MARFAGKIGPQMKSWKNLSGGEEEDRAVQCTALYLASHFLRCSANALKKGTALHLSGAPYALQGELQCKAGQLAGKVH